MHDSEDEHLFRLDAVENTEREAVHQTATDITFQKRPRFGVILNLQNRCRDFSGKITAQPRFLLFILGNGLQQIFFCAGMEGNRHQAKRSLIFLNTASPETA